MHCALTDALSPRACNSQVEKSKLSNLDRVTVLSEALPLLQKFRGKTIVVKYGGAAMKDPTLKVRGAGEQAAWEGCQWPTAMLAGWQCVAAQLMKNILVGWFKLVDRAAHEAAWEGSIIGHGRVPCHGSSVGARGAQ